MSLQARLLVLVGSLVAVLLAVSIGVFYRQLSQQNRAHAREALEVAQSTFRLIQEHNRERLEMAAAALEQEPGFRNVLRTHDQATAQDYLSEAMEAFRIDLVTVTDRTGRSLVSTQPIPAPDVSSALQGEIAWGYWSLSSGLYHVVSIPMTSSEDRVVGSLSVAQRVDERLAAALAKDTGCQVVLWSGSTRLAGTLGLDRVNEGQLVFGGVRYETAVCPVGSQAFLGLLKSTREADQRLAQSGLWLSLLGLTLLLVSLALSAPLLGRIANPIERLLKAEAQLRQSQAQLFQTSKMAAVGELAGGVAHELNTPLANVLVCVESSLTVLADRPEKAGPRLERARQSVYQMKEIIAKLLYYARDAVDKRESLQLNQVVEDTLQLVGHQLRVDQVEMELALGELPPLVANPNQLQQVITSLLLNARDALTSLPEGQPRQVRISTEVEGDSLELRVVDNGPGVPAEIANRIFEPFFTTRPVGSGTGLGLSIALQLVEQHGGSLSHCPGPPGAEFVMRLPKGPP